MDLAKSLIRSVARAFYETKQILVVDALMIHSALRDDDLAHLLGMQTKELRKLCAKLEEHRLLAVHNRQETREGMQRPISRTYYFVDFRQTIDTIKYRIYRITKEVEGMSRPTEEKKDYFCPRCKSRWTQMEVLDNPGPMGFDCHKCGGPLERDDENSGNRGGHEKQSKLMSQLDPLLKILRQIDDVLIPDSSFEAAFNAAVPVIRNKNTNPILPTAPVDVAGGAPTAVKGIAQAAPKIEVDLTSSADKSAAEQAAEARQRAKIAEQNALPIWHTNSTVSGEATALGTKEAEARRERELGFLEVKDEGEDDKKIKETDMSDELADYYAQLARDKELQAQKTQEEDEEDEEETSGSEGGDDDEDDEFEDVAVVNSAVPSQIPASSIDGSIDMVRKASAESESGGSGTGSSGPATGPTDSRTPLTSIGADEDRPSPSKKARTEGAKEEIESEEQVKREDSEEDEDDDEGVEFEDV